MENEVPIRTMKVVNGKQDSLIWSSKYYLVRGRVFSKMENFSSV